jgi:hypothetical protein
MPVPMMPAANTAKVSGPATARSASAAWAEVWISVTPFAFSVAAVVMTMNKATRLEIAMPI